MILHKLGVRADGAFSFGRMTNLAILMIALVGTSGAQESAPSSHAQPAKAVKPVPAKDEPSIKEDELKQQLLGKTMYLRNGYMENTLHFSQQAVYLGSAPKAPYTLSLIKIEKVHLSAHRLEVEGIRYGLHFPSEGSAQDALASADKVRITPKKKSLTITIERARVQKPKKEKTDKHHKGDSVQQAGKTAGQQEEGTPAPGPEVQPSSLAREEGVSMTQTQANHELRQAIDRVFAAGMDERMVTGLPDFWRFYFQAVTGREEYKPSEPGVLRQSAVDRKARLLAAFEPPSNEFAQNAGVAGMAQYHVVVNPDGHVAEVAVGRPIGFGLDENAVDSIRKATFEPALKDGHPVPVMLDLLVQFRIYSKRTGTTSAEQDSAAAQEAPVLPGPYSAKPPAPEPPKQP